MKCCQNVLIYFLISIIIAFFYFHSFQFLELIRISAMFKKGILNFGNILQIACLLIFVPKTSYTPFSGVLYVPNSALCIIDFFVWACNPSSIQKKTFPKGQNNHLMSQANPTKPNHATPANKMFPFQENQINYLHTAYISLAPGPYDTHTLHFSLKYPQ